MPRVTCDLPVSPVNTSGWEHLSDLPLADTSFDQPGRIDILLGVVIFVNILLQGRRVGPYGSPSALNTEFSWVLAGGTKTSNYNVAHHVVTVSGDDLLRRFWEVKEHQPSDLALTPEERFVIEHFKAFHSRDECGGFVVPLHNMDPQSDTQQVNMSSILSVKELELVEKHWISLVQETHFTKEIDLIKWNKTLPKRSCLITLHPFVDNEGILRLIGRIGHSNFSYKQLNPIILHGNHQITKMIVRAEHLRLLHVGPMMLASSIGVRFHIVGGKKVIRDVTLACVSCRGYSTRPQPQIMGQLPIERVTPGMIFEKVGIDYAGPIHVQYGYKRKPTIVKTYICVFVSLTIKAVHRELLSDLTVKPLLLV